MSRSEYADVEPVGLPLHDAVPARAAGSGSTPAPAGGTALAHEQAGRFPRRAAAPAGGEVMTYVAERVAPYERVRHVTSTDGVPRAASGKIPRRGLRTARGEPS
ncbi:MULTISPECIES: hypothetical protein [unclassified Streptomyces]|uniref:hypothetical protein n=1 Tax=unclassified Streptomyces TaxID=2593676 RepID=UPI0037019404